MLLTQRLRALVSACLQLREQEVRGSNPRAPICIRHAESQAVPGFGVAIITTKDTGCAEVAGDTALLVEPRSPESIRAALTRLTSDRELCRRLSMAAQVRMRDNFTWPAVAGRYVECYPTPRLSPIGVPAIVDVG